MLWFFFQHQSCKMQTNVFGHLREIVFLRNTNAEFFVRIEEKEEERKKEKKFQKDELELEMNDSVFSIFEIRKRDWIEIEKIE